MLARSVFDEDSDDDDDTPSKNRRVIDPEQVLNILKKLPDFPEEERAPEINVRRGSAHAAVLSPLLMSY
jgi:hypothetical protein